MLARGAIACLSALAACRASTEDCVAGSQVWDAPPSDVVCVRGDLIVESRSAKELAILAGIEDIEGSLVIHDNPALDELPEWPALTHIGGAFSLSENAVLTVVHGFPALERIDGRLYVAENPKLSQFALGDALVSVGSIFVALNPELMEFAAPAALAQVEGDLNISANNGLERLELPGLSDVAGSLYIEDNVALALAKFPALRMIGGDLSISGDLSLETLNGFEGLERVAGQVTISDNDELKTFSLAASIDTPSIFIMKNAALTRISGSAPARIGAHTSVSIQNNLALRSIDDFSGVEALAGLTIEENEALIEITGLRSLVRVGPYNLSVVRNASLAGPADWFPALAEASELRVFGNKSLPPSVVQGLLDHVTVEGDTRVGDNQGEETALDPCPWAGDGLCDAISPAGAISTQLCAIDPEDCL